MIAKSKSNLVKSTKNSNAVPSKKVKKELIEIAPYQVEKVKVIPFQTRTISYVVWILVGAFLITLTMICLIKFLG